MNLRRVSVCSLVSPLFFTRRSTSFTAASVPSKSSHLSRFAGFVIWSLASSAAFNRQIRTGVGHPCCRPCTACSQARRKPSRTSCFSCQDWYPPAVGLALWPFQRCRFDKIWFCQTESNPRLAELNLLRSSPLLSVVFSDYTARDLLSIAGKRAMDYLRRGAFAGCRVAGTKHNLKREKQVFYFMTIARRKTAEYDVHLARYWVGDVVTWCDADRSVAVRWRGL